jgi:streptogramin lyase
MEIRILRWCCLPFFAYMLAAQPVITEWPTPTPGASPSAIVTGPDGNLWIAYANISKIGRITTAGVITEFPVVGPSASLAGICSGPDGNLWFTDRSNGRIGKITTAGVVTEYTVPTASSAPWGITAGPDGNLWFVEFAANKVGRITTAGVFTEFSIPTPANPLAITSGADGNLWFTELMGNNGSIGRITPSGTITEFPQDGIIGPYLITGGPDGNLWFTDGNNRAVRRITPDGVVTEFLFPTGNTGGGITTGPDGALWFVEVGIGVLGRITTWGAVTEYVIPSGAGVPFQIEPLGITAGPDGNIWFTEQVTSKIARAALVPAPTSIAPVGVSPASGSGLSQTFTFTFNDPAGFSDLYVLDVLVSTFLDGRTACYFALAPTGATTGYLYLVDDAGDGGYAPGTPMPLPSNNSLGNSQCALNGTGSSISSNGNTLTLTLSITFNAAFAGNKAVYMAARSKTQNSGWQALGTWNVPGAAPAGPAVGAVSPARSTSAGEIYTFTFTDANGFSDLFVLDILTNSFLNGPNGCYIAYVPTIATNGYLYLVDDAGDGGYAPGSPVGLSSGSVLQNGQCSINTAASSASASGNTLTLNLALAFNPAFAGNQVFFLAARNASTGNSGWQAAGSVTVP